MKLVREAISFERKRDPKETLLGTYKPGKIYAWYYEPFGEVIFMMFINYNTDENKDHHPLAVCEFAYIRKYSDEIIFRYPDFNNVTVLQPLTEEQKMMMEKKLNNLDEEERGFLREIKEETNLVPYV